MPPFRNEIRDHAIAFSCTWADERSEDAEAKSLREGFFRVFLALRDVGIRPAPYGSTRANDDRVRVRFGGSRESRSSL